MDAGETLQNCGRPWPHEREGPASVAQWEGWNEVEVLQSFARAMEQLASEARMEKIDTAPVETQS